MSSPKPNVDWAAVELRYRSGTESLRTIGAAFDVTEGAIRLRAKKYEWTRDLQVRVRQATEKLLVRKSATRNLRTEADHVAVEATMRSDVVLAHRADVGRGRRLALKMLTELEDQTDDIPSLRELGEMLRNPDQFGKDRLNDIYMAVIALPERTKTLKALAESLRILVSIEREAFGIAPPSDGDKPQGNAADVLQALVDKLPD